MYPLTTFWEERTIPPFSVDGISELQGHKKGINPNDGLSCVTESNRPGDVSGSYRMIHRIQEPVYGGKNENGYRLVYARTCRAYTHTVFQWNGGTVCLRVVLYLKLIEISSGFLKKIEIPLFKQIAYLNFIEISQKRGLLYVLGKIPVIM